MHESRSEVLVLRTTSEAGTLEIGRALGRRIDRGVWISLEGGLGSGKTVLARGICAGLGVREEIVSPSFILCEEYAGRLPVVHTDFYRLESEREIEDLGLLDRADGETVVLSEWGDRSRRVHGAADIVVHIVVAGPTEREIEVRFRRDDAGWFEGLPG